MISAYILIETAPGMAGLAAEKIRQIPFVTSASAVTGPYDVICTVQADSLADLGKNVVARIQKTDGVARTLTCLNVDH